MNNAPVWLIEAFKYINLKEIKGSVHAPDILQFWKDIKRGGIKDDETPWCASFVGAMLERAGIRSTRFEGASSYEQWGNELLTPKYGCVVTFRRKGGSHVGFVVGSHPDGSLQVLGGNQNDAVTIADFPRARVSSLRWPIGYKLDNRILVQVPMNSSGLPNMV